MLLLRDMTINTLLPDQSLFALHVCDVTGREALATDYYYYNDLEVVRRPG